MLLLLSLSLLLSLLLLSLSLLLRLLRGLRGGWSLGEKPGGGGGNQLPLPLGCLFPLLLLPCALLYLRSHRSVCVFTRKQVCLQVAKRSSASSLKNRKPRKKTQSSLSARRT
jgi:hypothetical protein